MWTTLVPKLGDEGFKNPTPVQRGDAEAPANRGRFRGRGTHDALDAREQTAAGGGERGLLAEVHLARCASAPA